MKYITHEAEAPQVGCYSGENVIAMIIAVGDREVLKNSEDGPGVSGKFIVTHLYRDENDYRFRSTTGTGLRILIPEGTESDIEAMTISSGFGAIVRHLWEKGYRHFTLQEMPGADSFFIEQSVESMKAAVIGMEHNDAFRQNLIIRRQERVDAGMETLATKEELEACK